MRAAHACPEVRRGARLHRDCRRTFAAAMLCASNMSALIPPVAPPSSAAGRFCPSHHTLGREALAALLEARGWKLEVRAISVHRGPTSSF